MRTPSSRPPPRGPVLVAACCLLLGCSDGPAAPVEEATPPDPRAIALGGFLDDPWITEVVDGIADPDLRIPFARFAGEVESLDRSLRLAQDQELTPEDRLLAAILELSLLAAERPSGPEPTP